MRLFAMFLSNMAPLLLSLLPLTTTGFNTNLNFPFIKHRPYTTLSPLHMADPIKITMPALSSTMKEGKIVSWLKDEGDTITAGDVVMVVESDKADMDVEAFEDGFMAKILTGEGDTANVGDVVALVAEEKSDIAAIAGGAEHVSADEEVPQEAVVEEEGEGVDTTEIFMPALSSTMSEGKIVSWLKSPGDFVAAGEALMVVESDKADMDVEAFEDGYLAKILTDEGDTAEVGAPVGILVENIDDVDKVRVGPVKAKAAAASPAPAPAVSAVATAAVAAPAIAAAMPKPSGDRVVASPFAKRRAAELGLDLSTVAGTGPDGRITASDVENAIKGAPPPPKKPEVPAKPTHVPLPGVIPATPMARQLAKKAGLELTSITGTGNFGRVTENDVKLATGEMKPERKKRVVGGEEIPELPDGLVPFDAMKRGVSRNMEATLDVPIFRCSRDIEMNKFDDLYQKVKPKNVSVSSLLAKAVALALEKHPVINAAYHPDGGTVYKSDINIAMAVAIDGGLITPTLRNANEKDIYELGQDWRELVDKAKSNSLKPEEYTTGTFTITNLGMFGVNQFDAILPKGTGSILAIGATRDEVVPDKLAVMGMKICKRMTVTITCDHRVIYGADGASFMKTFAEVMENPETML